MLNLFCYKKKLGIISISVAFFDKFQTLLNHLIFGIINFPNLLNTIQMQLFSASFWCKIDDNRIVVISCKVEWMNCILHSKNKFPLCLETLFGTLWTKNIYIKECFFTLFSSIFKQIFPILKLYNWYYLNKIFKYFLILIILIKIYTENKKYDVDYVVLLNDKLKNLNY